MSPRRLRVAAYVLRQRRSWELLIFEQVGRAHAGVQIPAGGVRTNETLEEAALREVHEETGLSALRLRTRLLTEDKPHPLTGQPRSTTFFVIDAPSETPDVWEHSVCGDDADAGLTFNCRFASLPLPDNQDAWLGIVDERFSTASRCGG